MRIYTIGHGARPLDEFLATLDAAGVEGVADVRRYPGSRRHPHFGRESLEQALMNAGKAYLWLPSLGGRRPRMAAPSPNPAWQVEAFRNYADYMDTAEFTQGLDLLLAFAQERRCAAMCAERHPSQCHRRLIADKLTVLGHEVVHLLAPDRAEVHRLPPFARSDGTRVRYDLPVDDSGQGKLLHDR